MLAFAVVLEHVGRRAFKRFATIDIILSVLIGSNLSDAFFGNASFLPTPVATTAMVVVYSAL
jgi:uncharacterized membrane protein YcaP (DUF421 family)